MYMHTELPTVCIFLENHSLSALWKSMRIVWIFENCQVTAKKYTYRSTSHMHAHAQHMNFKSSHTVTEIQWYAKTLQNT